MLTLFLFSVFIILFTYFGYPLLLYLKCRGLSPKESSNNLTEGEKLNLPVVTVIIIAFNEQNRVIKKVDNILESNYPKDKLQIIIASDGSTDSMCDLLKDKIKSEALESQVSILDFRERRGKAACLNDAIGAAKTEHLILCDVRQTISSNAIYSLITSLLPDEIGAVSGELIFAEEGESGFSKGMDAYWRYEKFIRQSEARIDSVIGVTGALYALKRSLFQPIPKGTILDDVLIPMNVVLKGKRVLFCQDAYAVDVPSSDPIKEKARKKRTLAGNFQLIELRRELINPNSNRLFFQFVSHKLLRLIAPYFMILAFFSNLSLVHTHIIFAALFLGQCAIYAIAMIGNYLPNAREKKWVRIPHAFVSLNWFSVLGFIEYIKSEKTYLW